MPAALLRKIANCFNYAVITSTGNNVGGLVGYTYQNAVIENCANFGAVTGGSSAAALSAVQSAANGSTITGRYNTAEISATGSKAGGIIGGTSSEMTVTSCYNTGKISRHILRRHRRRGQGQCELERHCRENHHLQLLLHRRRGSAVFGTVDTASSEISALLSEHAGCGRERRSAERS